MGVKGGAKQVLNGFRTGDKGEQRDNCVDERQLGIMTAGIGRKEGGEGREMREVEGRRFC
jgi:hypothetical protein